MKDILMADKNKTLLNFINLEEEVDKFDPTFYIFNAVEKLNDDQYNILFEYVVSQMVSSGKYKPKIISGVIEKIEELLNKKIEVGVYSTSSLTLIKNSFKINNMFHLFPEEVFFSRFQHGPKNKLFSKEFGFKEVFSELIKKKYNLLGYVDDKYEELRQAGDAMSNLGLENRALIHINPKHNKFFEQTYDDRNNRCYIVQSFSNIPLNILK